MPSAVPAPFMDASPGHCLTLTQGVHRLRVAPRAGGRILEWSSALPEGRRDWLEPIRIQEWPAHEWPKGGLFPLAPFSNRIRDARMQWADQVIPIEPLPGQAHALHGQAQGMAWRVQALDAAQITLHLHHPRGGGGWPWAWSLRQTIELSADGQLKVELRLCNDDTSPMPAGLGLHPYFTASQVQLTATTEWAHAEELALFARPNSRKQWQRTPETWTAFLSAWSGQAQILWPTGPGLHMQTYGPLGHVVLHCNAGRYLCVEPATHVCDAFNLAAAGAPDTGARALAPQETLSVGMILGIL